MRTVTRIPNSFSTSTNDPLFRFRSVLRTWEDELGQHEKDEAFPSSFSLWKWGGPRGKAPSSAASVTYSF